MITVDLVDSKKVVVEITEREIQLIKTLRTLQINNRESIISLRYVPIGESGHISQIYRNTPVKTHNIGLQLYKLLQELKRGYLENTLFTIYWQPDIGVLQCFNGETLVNRNDPVDVL